MLFTNNNQCLGVGDGWRDKPLMLHERGDLDLDSQYPHRVSMGMHACNPSSREQRWQQEGS